MLSGAVIIWRPDWVWEIEFQDYSPAWLFPGGFSSSPHDMPQKDAQLLSWHILMTGSPKASGEQRGLGDKEASIGSFMFYHTCCHFCLVRGDSLKSSQQSQKEELGFIFWMEWQRIHGHMIKSPYLLFF